MKAMKKKMYVSPETDMRTVELEKGFMEASSIKEEESEVRSNTQEIEREYTFGQENEDIWK